MARIRTIKPEFPHSESIGRLSREARLLFILIWTVLDDEGRVRGNSRMLASLLYPFDDDAPSLIEGWLGELEHEGCVRRYEVEGNTYLDVPKWLKHQKIDKPSNSKIPKFVEGPRALASPPETLAPDLGPRTIVSRTLDLVPSAPGGAREDSLSDEFETWWASYPHKVAKPAAKRAFTAARRKVSQQTLLAGVDHYRATKPHDRAWCNPATWLNNERWNDQPAASGGARPGRASAIEVGRSLINELNKFPEAS